MILIILNMAGAPYIVCAIVVATPGVPWTQESFGIRKCLSNGPKQHDAEDQTCSPHIVISVPQFAPTTNLACGL